MTADAVRLREQRDQALRDLAELDQQVETGEIDRDTARRLGEGYRSDLDRAEDALASLEQEARPQAAGRSRGRVIAGTAILAVSLAAVVLAVGSFAVDRNPDSVQGAADLGDGLDPDQVSNETLEAVVAANATNPMINGMRLALAGRYFEERSYQEAFPHYQAVLDNDPSAPEAGEALARLGWMVYDGNGEVKLALSLLEQSLDAFPGDPFTIYLLARVTWCGAGDAAGAVPLLEQVLSSPGLDPEVAPTVEGDLAVASAGGACP